MSTPDCQTPEEAIPQPETVQPVKRKSGGQTRPKPIDPATKARIASKAEERRADNARKRRAEIEGRRPEAPLSMLVEIEWTGAKFELRRPEELRWLSEARLRRLILDVLALAALGGSVQAARTWLDERRWSEEMKRGKAPSRLRLDQTLSVQVVDDLSAAAATVAMERTKPGQIGSLRGVRCLPAHPITMEQPANPLEKPEL